MNKFRVVVKNLALGVIKRQMTVIYTEQNYFKYNNLLQRFLLSAVAVFASINVILIIFFFFLCAVFRWSVSPKINTILSANDQEKKNKKKREL